MCFEKGGFAMGNKDDAKKRRGAWVGSGLMADLGTEGKAGKAPPAKAVANDGDREPSGEAAEHLSRDFARVRARLAVDPALVGRSLAAAWTTDVMEEDEAEFVDTLADCMGAGLSLETALTGWDIGTLVTEPIQDTVAADEEDPSEAYVAVALAHRQAPGSRRLLVR